MAKKTLEKQAQAMVRASTFTHPNAKGHVNTNHNHNKGLQSVRSAKDTALALAKIAKEMKVERIKHISDEMANQYLLNRRDNYASQQSLDRDRKALSIATKSDFSRLKAISENILNTRAYSAYQIDKITEAMTERNALAVKIAHDAGLRTHELITLRRQEEGKKTESRIWTKDRFTGRAGNIYLVTGKGGLVREVKVSKNLSLQLEQRRLSSPKERIDRGVNYQQRYDLGGGNHIDHLSS